MYRTIFLLFISFFSCTAAGCEDIADLRTNRIDLYISDGGCDGDTMISFSKIDRYGKIVEGSLKTFPFYTECFLLWNGSKSSKKGHFDDGNYNGFSCKAKGHTLILLPQIIIT
jgi:hypothetical protein